MKIVLVLLSVIYSSIAFSKTQGTIVFVHGAWGGGWDYQALGDRLTKKGYQVYRPTLTGLGERVHLSHPGINLDTHILDIINLIKVEGLKDIILVGHSYGGMVITGVADKLPERISHLLYVDAILPEDGESMFSLISVEEVALYRQLAANNKGQEWTIPPFWPDWGKDVPHPIATFEQTISLTNKAKSIPSSYLLTIEPNQSDDDFLMFAQRAKQRNWQYYELKTGHNVHRTMPDEYVAIIEQLK
ncbi:alpha/beta hydrolase [Thalassotalea sp. LPB0316]|uniref:alpha/beta fold hydrolase n=1 Tax=Thalassotalea sp. LPB0316 TaxID=2769490 RepID=UPI00186705F3|nr:alpha/beta hydrolase [Thalassotalea sp. LPB0316]QOL25128.1 alpha/beta hydrolase [Thalassotalea sp. LPB0316]